MLLFNNKINKIKKAQFPTSLIILLMGIFIVIYMLFGEDTTISNPSRTTIKDSIVLPSVYLTSQQEKELIASIPYIVLDSNNNEKKYFFKLKNSYDHLEAFYQLKENQNCNILVYFNNYLVSFNKLGNGYYKYIEKPIYEDNNELEIRFVCQKQGFSLFKKPKAIIKDFVVEGFKEYNKAQVTFSAEEEDYLFKAKPSNCEKGSLEIQVNECPSFLINFNCNSFIEYTIPKICLNYGKNTIKFKLISGKLSLMEPLLIPINKQSGRND
jgi:hypothetical protein